MNGNSLSRTAAILREEEVRERGQPAAQLLGVEDDSRRASLTDDTLSMRARMASQGRQWRFKKEEDGDCRIGRQG